jgi:hypothetical protein
MERHEGQERKKMKGDVGAIKERWQERELWEEERESHEGQQRKKMEGDDGSNEGQGRGENNGRRRGRVMRDSRERRWKETRGAMRDRAGERIMVGGGET